MIKTINKCRVCKSPYLKDIFSLGKQSLSSLPVDLNEKIMSVPLDLVKCSGECETIQLKHSIDRSLIYGDKYGYKSSINKTMTNHLKAIVKMILRNIELKEGDRVVDIGSNDGTLLGFYPDYLDRYGVDPSGLKFFNKYREGISLFSDYFNKSQFVNNKAKVITSIAMFYDLENPIKFAKDIYSCLTDDGIWVFEQSDVYHMLKNNSYDTICHEHLEYYGIDQIVYILSKSGFKMIHAEQTKSNGGSLLVTAAKRKFTQSSSWGKDITLEIDMFITNIKHQKEQLVSLINQLKKKKKIIYGYGASTKGNVILQYCGLGNKITAIADRNPEKWGKYTPGTNIPIISEKEARKAKPDYMLVLPWHFKDEFIKREKKYLDGGGKFIFPLPNVEIYP